MVIRLCGGSSPCSDDPARLAPEARTRACSLGTDPLSQPCPALGHAQRPPGPCAETAAERAQHPPDWREENRKKMRSSQNRIQEPDIEIAKAPGAGALLADMLAGGFGNIS